jgi:hypothetical protein
MNYSQEEIDDYEDGLREQEFNNEYDYLDKQIGKIGKIGKVKSTVSDKTLVTIKRSKEQILKEKNEQQYLCDQNREKQLRLNEVKTSEQQQQKNVPKKFNNLTSKEEEKEVAEKVVLDDWEDLL